MIEKASNTTDFQTPPCVAKYMASLVPAGVKTILEPSAGKGNLVKEITSIVPWQLITAPLNFFEMDFKRFDCVIMNPPFSSKYAYGVPADIEHRGMRLGYYFLTKCMEMSDNVIALMPWFTISDSDVRLRFMKNWGLKSITALPRKTFQYARIQTCVFELQKGFEGETIFKVFDNLER